MMEENKILSATADTILEKPMRIDVEILQPRWWEKIAMKAGLMKARRSFMIRPATLGNMIRISQLLLGVDVELYKTTSFLDASYQVIGAHAETMARVIATAVNNGKDTPSERLVRFFLHNLTAKELKTISAIAVKHMDVENFMISIVSIRGRNILETSPRTQRS